MKRLLFIMAIATLAMPMAYGSTKESEASAIRDSHGDKFMLSEFGNKDVFCEYKLGKSNSQAANETHDRGRSAESQSVRSVKAR